MKKVKKPGIVIVIDGGDGSGKKTQTQLTAEKLNHLGYLTKTIDFPQRKGFFGKFIYQCLEEGICGDFANIHPKIASVLYAADRAMYKDQIEDWLNSGKNVIADRYASANQIHQGGKIKEDSERKEFMEFLDEMEYKQFMIPRPTIVFYLDVPVAISLKLIQEQKEKEKGDTDFKRRKTDQHEDSPEHQIAARESAIKMLSNDSWVHIKCSDDGISLLPKEVINERIIAHCLKIL
jgi:dTMP kinase